MSDWTDLLYRSMYGPPSNPAGYRFGGASPFRLHDYRMPGMPNTWDWSEGGRIGRWNSVNGGEKTSCNGVIGHISGSLNYKVEVRNMEVWLRVDGTWRRYFTSAGNDAALIFGSYYRSSNFSHNGGMTEETGPAGGCMFQLRELNWSHFYCRGSNANVNVPSGFQRLHVRAQYRLVGSAAASSIAMGRIGADYYIVDPSIPKGFVRPSVFIAPMLRITNEWRWFTATTLEPSLITGSQAPPEPGAFVPVDPPDLPDTPDDPDPPDPEDPPDVDDPDDPTPPTPALPNQPQFPRDEEAVASEFSPYDLSERSVQLSAPIEIYEFQSGNGFWRYTSAEADVIFDRETYFSRPVKRTPVAVTEEQSRNSMTITGPRNLEVADAFRITPPTAVISLIVRRVDRVSGDAAVVWSGRLLNVGWRGSSVELQCEPSSFSLDRNGLRRVWGPQCPHVLYGTKCKVDRFAFRTVARVTGVSGDTVTVDTLEAKPYAGGFILRVGTDAGNISHLHYIRSFTGTTLRISGRANYFEPDDIVEIFPGCNHTTAVCSGTYNNILNYGGQPYFPNNNPFEGDQVY